MTNDFLASDAADGAGRKQRLRIIVVAGVIIVLAGLVPSIIGTRQANGEVERIRVSATSATLDLGDVAESSYGGSGTDPIAAALGVSDGEISASSLDGSQWCIHVDVQRLLTSRTIAFRLDSSGLLREDPSCGRE